MCLVTVLRVAWALLVRIGLTLVCASVNVITLWTVGLLLMTRIRPRMGLVSVTGVVGTLSLPHRCLAIGTVVGGAPMMPVWCCRLSVTGAILVTCVLTCVCRQQLTLVCCSSAPSRLSVLLKCLLTIVILVRVLLVCMRLLDSLSVWVKASRSSVPCGVVVISGCSILIVLCVGLG